MLFANSFIVIFALSIKCGAATLLGVCNECMSSNSVACVDETHFAVCNNNQPVATITSCPGNLVCTDDVLICRSSGDGFTPICYQDYCGDCDATNGVFTCLDKNTYGYCFGGNTPNSEAIRSCPVGYVCSINSANICVPEVSNQPSCVPKVTTTTEIITTTDEPTTTTVAPRTANEICREIAKLGYFKSDDPTCREHVYCYPLSGQYLGWFYYCDGYFNAQTQKCQIERPLDCVKQ